MLFEVQRSSGVEPPLPEAYKKELGTFQSNLHAQDHVYTGWVVEVESLEALIEILHADPTISGFGLTVTVLCPFLEILDDEEDGDSPSDPAERMIRGLFGGNHH